VTKSLNSEWPRLAGAAVGARDELRRLAADLTKAMDEGRIPRALIISARDTAQRHAIALQAALKHPATEPHIRRAKDDLPCWMTLEGRKG
jgi:hypothetical protein